MYSKIYKYCIPTYSDKSIPTGDATSLRFDVATEQKAFDKVDIDIIIDLVFELFAIIGLETDFDDFNPKYKLSDDLKLRKNPTKPRSWFYCDFKNKFDLNDKRDIIWMKFTKSGHLGVVGKSNDINFDPQNTSNKIIKHIGQEWDENFVLIFPLKNIPEGLNRALIESAVGNYLIQKGVPILDYYSHNF